MEILDTPISGLFVIKPKVHIDGRGYFMESFNSVSFNQHFADTTFVQDNESKSNRCVLRGLHCQLPPFEQSKLVRVIEGEIFDVAVDVRTESQTYGSFFSITLNDENKKQLFVPKGFLHGFLVLSETAIVNYKVDNLYSPEHDSGVIFNDPNININWPIGFDEMIISSKDSKLSKFEEFISPF